MSPDQQIAPERAASKKYERSVLVVEDDSFVRSLIASSLEANGFLVSSVSTAADAKRLIDRIDPDAVVLDIDLGPGANGFDIADMLRAKSNDVAILFLTSLPDPRFAGRDSKAVYKGAAYLNKHLLSDTATLVEALDAVLTERGVDNYRHHELDGRPLSNLSRTQIQVLQLLAEGKTNQQIADIRKRSLAATSSAVTRTLEAIGVDANAELNVRVAAAIKYVGSVSVPSQNPL